MKKVSSSMALVTVVALLALMVGCQGVQQPTEQSDAQISVNSSVEPATVDNWQSGDAEFECGNTACSADFAYKEDWSASGADGNYVHAGATITISNSSDLQSFDWSISSGYSVCAVIVKGGTKANIFYYDPPSTGDTHLYAPINPNNNMNFDISHVTFCFSQDEQCFQGETAWAAGTRYTSRGNWATYTNYDGVAKTVTLFAGQTLDAGTVQFGAPAGGQVTININLSNGFIFYYDPGNPVADDNLKVQDYATAPSGNPSPGLFAWKTMIPVGSTSGSITVPVNNVYGIHVDVAYPVPCE